MTKTKESNRRTIAVWVLNLALLLIVAGTAMPIFRVSGDAFRYIYCAGALISLICQISLPYDGKSLRAKRLSRLEVWSSIMFCVGGFFMWYKGAGPMDWLAFTLAGGAIRIYTSIMIPRAESKG